MADYAEVVYWLTALNSSGLKLNVLKPIILRWCLGENRSLAELYRLSTLEFTTTFGLPESDAEQFLGAEAQIPHQAAKLAEWQSQGLVPIIRTDASYPKRFANHLAPIAQPLVLWGRGELALLNQPGVTILGQQGDDPSTATFIEELVAVLEQDGIGLISGYSRGLDRATFELMVNTPRGFGVAMLPMGLGAFLSTTPKLNEAISGRQALVISPFAPDTAFDEKLAQARNLLIDHLTLALLIPQSDEDAIARATAALERGLPVLIKEDTAGNRELLKRGALLLTDTGEVIDWVQQALVDDAMQETPPETPGGELAAAPLTVTAQTSPDDSDDDYSLRVEEVPPLDSEEALDVLSLGGEIPEVLRKRLEERSDPSKD
jgi:predicted Rossmann fold nucleotide-binding protein DprA/Smf involved in DNA uptake